MDRFLDASRSACCASGKRRNLVPHRGAVNRGMTGFRRGVWRDEGPPQVGHEVRAVAALVGPRCQPAGRARIMGMDHGQRGPTQDGSTGLGEIGPHDESTAVLHLGRANEAGSQARADIGRWIMHYNYHRPRTAHGGQPPAVICFNHIETRHLMQALAQVTPRAVKGSGCNSRHGDFGAGKGACGPGLGHRSVPDRLSACREEQAVTFSGRGDQ